MASDPVGPLGTSIRKPGRAFCARSSLQAYPGLPAGPSHFRPCGPRSQSACIYEALHNLCALRTDKSVGGIWSEYTRRQPSLRDPPKWISQPANPLIMNDENSSLRPQRLAMGSSRLQAWSIQPRLSGRRCLPDGGLSRLLKKESRSDRNRAEELSYD